MYAPRGEDRSFLDTASPEFTALFGFPIQAVATLLAAVVVAAGWIVTYLFNRKLQRQKVSVELLQSLTHQAVYQAADKKVFKRCLEDEDNIRNDRSPYIRPQVAGSPAFLPTSTNTWVALSQQIHEPTTYWQLDAWGDELYSALRVVLTAYEFIATAVRDKGADEEVIFKQIGFRFPYLFAQMWPYIDYMRRVEEAEDIYEHFEFVARRWARRHNPPLTMPPPRQVKARYFIRSG